MDILAQFLASFMAFALCLNAVVALRSTRPGALKGGVAVADDSGR